jgi:NADH dehydrogenase
VRLAESKLKAMSQQPPRVVIIGAGFAGLQTAKKLAHAPVEITIIDRHNYHCFQPLLYQVATAALSPADIAWPVRHILRSQKNAAVFMADVIGIDTEARVVKTQALNFPYDFLVVATGAMHAYFGHDAWGAFAPGLKSIEDATYIRRSILSAFEQAELARDEAERARLLTFVIVGGGPTGVEMAGAIAEIARQTLARDFRRIDPRSARCILIEAGPRLLPSFSEKNSDYARAALTKMGVEVMTGSPVISCDQQGVNLPDRRIDAASIIWAAGVVASPAAKWLGAQCDRVGRVIVGPDLSLPGHPEIFVIGDTASAQENGRPIPGLAPAAKQMGGYVASLIMARLAGQSLRPFHYRDLGELATVGRRAAVVEFGGLRITGFVGWLFWSVVHIYFLIGVRNRVTVALTWLWSYITFQRGARLITRSQRQ